MKCGGDFRSVKDSDDLFKMTEQEARELFSTPKETSKKASARSASRSSSQAVVDFGDHEGKPLGIYHGRYGFYLRHGSDNVRIAKEYQQNEEACKSMSKETAVSFLK